MKNWFIPERKKECIEIVKLARKESLTNEGDFITQTAVFVHFTKEVVKGRGTGTKVKVKVDVARQNLQSL